ncbi:LrgB family protein [Paraglaciecola sp. 2405UD69-4]|uniref:LrgB family protein n=1 Tax=Paraglaciecola sp. 2405UD69-4 TaxID=3391836 RepID=UPI0039C98C13
MVDWYDWLNLTSIGWVIFTVIAYISALFIFRLSRNNLVFHPIVIAAVIVAGLCVVTNTELSDYALYSQPLSWLLGPITVALAVPVYQQLRSLVAAGWRGFCVVVCAGLLAPVCTLVIMNFGDYSNEIKLSSLTKSITTPLAMDTSHLIGGVPALAAAVVIITGLIGVLLSKLVFKITKNKDQRAQGLALGTIAHAIGTSQAMQLSQKTGVYSSMALCVNGIVTAIVLPLFFYLFGS